MARDSFSNKFGIIAAAAGSAIGLGNIWRFPYVLGENGGSAFLIFYLLFIIAIGVPIMVAELIIGRRSRTSVFGSFKKLRRDKPLFHLVGVLGLLTAFIILSFYSVVAGWTANYTYLAITNSLADKSPEELNLYFKEFSSSVILPIIYMIIFMTLCAFVVIGGIKNGIEKYSKILMPALLVIIIILSIRASLLPGAIDGWKFLFKPDFSKLNASVILEVVGQVFFSLSIGMGALITYGSYVKKGENLLNIAISVSLADTLIAILSGIAIFPAVFAFKINPDVGPGLVFVTLPNIFNKMIGGYIFSIAFFVLLLIAALTSGVSLLEVVVAYMREHLHIKRKKATITASVLVSIIGILCIIIPSLFDQFDWTSSNILLPTGGIFISIFVGWYIPKSDLYDELSGHGVKHYVFEIIIFILKYIAPTAIFLVFLNNLGAFK